LSELDRLAGELSRCRICRDLSAAQRLPHEPRPIFQLSGIARLFICSQAPGARAHASGIPFSDPSGVRLRSWMGVTEAEFYDPAKIAIIPIGFCFPGHDKNGGDLPPRAECARHWRSRIFKSLPQPPELILLVGAYSQRWHLGGENKPSLTETLKAWRSSVERTILPKLLPLPHPSWRNSGWLKKNPWFEDDVLPYLRREVRRMLAG
jgi:uracil-DNA glycosylase